MAKILIVDDDKDFRKIYSRYLVEDGFEVFEAPEKDRALDPSRHPDIILLDMRMPGAEARLFIPQLREVHPGAKIVVASSYDTNYQKSVAGGAEAYFDKADGCQALSSKLKTLLPAASGPSAAAAPSGGAEGELYRDPRVRTFIHRLAHDLRGPVGKVITTSELLLERGKHLEDRDREYLAKLAAYGKEIKTLIDLWTAQSDG